MKVVVKDNTGYSSTHGEISNILKIGEVVEVLYQDGCCYKIKKSDGYEGTFNMSRFEG